MHFTMDIFGERWVSIFDKEIVNTNTYREDTAVDSHNKVTQ